MNKTKEKFVFWDTHLFTAGRFKTNSKNFFRRIKSASSVNRGLISIVFLSPVVSTTAPFVATLFFFRKAAENPEAQTYVTK